MRPLSLAFVLLGLPILWPSAVSAQSAVPSSELASNAAIQYWQAFAQMPTLDKDQEKLLERWNTVPLDAAAKQLIAASQNSLMYLHRAAKLERCDWGLDYNDGISLMLPHLAKARDLARLAALHGRNEFEQGHWKAGRNDAVAMMTLARHVGHEPIMVCLLVRYVIEEATVELVAPYAADVKAPYAQAVAQYEALPKAATLQETIFTEKKFIAEWMIQKLHAEEQRQKGAGLVLWKKIVESPETPAAVTQIDSLEEAVRLTQDLIPMYDQIAKLVASPKDEFDAQFPPFKEKVRAVNPVASLLLPPLEKVRAKGDRNEARMAMLLAAIAVVEGGPQKLADIKDPFGTGPFDYHAVDNGFELKSKLLYEGQPVTLTVGRQKKD